MRTRWNVYQGRLGNDRSGHGGAVLGEPREYGFGFNKKGLGLATVLIHVFTAKRIPTEDPPAIVTRIAAARAYFPDVPGIGTMRR